MKRWIATLCALAVVLLAAVALLPGEDDSRSGGGLTSLTGPARAYAIDPNDPAMVLSDTEPCVAPCVKTDIVYRTTTSPLNAAAGTQSLALDLFRGAKTPKRDAPVVVVMHGGGFVEGDKSIMRLVSETLANAGFLVANIDYRLADKERNNGLGIVKQADIVPASKEAEEDAEAAMRFIRAHAKEYGATTDRQRYAVGGYSAGAIAALRVAIRGGDKATSPARRWRVGAAFSISGTECGRWSEQFGCKAAYDAKDPPILMFHGEADSIVSFTYGSQTCTSAVLRGGGCTAYYYPNQDHFWASGTIFGGGKKLSKKRPAVLPTVAKFLRKELAAKPTAKG